MGDLQMGLLAAMLDRARQDTLDIASGVPESNRLLQLAPGRATPLWLVGHLANTVNAVVLHWTLEQPSLLTRDQAMLFAPDFAGGAPPTEDPAMYPPWETVTGWYGEALSRCAEGVKALSDADFDKPLPGRIPEPLREIFPSIGATLMRMVSHDAYHRGQIGMLARVPSRN